MHRANTLGVERPPNSTIHHCWPHPGAKLYLRRRSVMATFTLQTLELRAALLTGARATGQGSKGQRTAMGGNPAQVLSLPWHPLPGHPNRIDPESVADHRTYSMDIR